MRPQRRLARKIEAALRRRGQRRGQGRLRSPAVTASRGRAVRSQDLLPRNPERVGEDRAQALVALNQVAERSLQRSAVERAGSRTASGIV